jgi:hypothetical protein
MIMNEAIWRKAEANQVMRERRRLFKIGHITRRSVPNILIKDEDGNWRFPDPS